MATELTAIEDSAAGIALQLTLRLMDEVSMNSVSVLNAFNGIYWGVLETLNPEGWKSTECSPTKTATDSGHIESD